MPFLMRLLQLLAALLMLRLLLRFVAAFVRGLTSPDAAASRGDAGATDLVRDRMCNTFVPRASALRAQLGGHEQYFCSAACREKALALLKAS
jgi:hypothetical protein